MLFHEVYGCYYNIMAKILTLAMQDKLTEEKMLTLIRKNAFAESTLTIMPAIKQEKWQLIKENKSILKHSPSLPLTTLELRWLKAISLDARIKLFDIDFSVFEKISTISWEEIVPLYQPQDYIIFDQYKDGDPYEDAHYIQVFHTIQQAMKKGQRICVEYISRKGERRIDSCRPYHLEYSEKDDKFRVYAKANRRRYIMNIARIGLCEIVDWPEYSSKNGKKKQVFLPLLTSKGRYRQAYFILELIDERNALERVMLHFAHFEKRAEHLEDKRYRIKILYDREDETELVIRVLSFGSMVKVTDPLEFIDCIKERLYQQKGCGLK